MNCKRRYTPAQVKDAVATSSSIAQVLKKLGLVPAGGNYQNIKQTIQLLGLDTRHFTGQGHLKGKSHDWSKKRPLSEIMVENSDFQSSHLRKRLINEGVLEPKCHECDLTEWRGKPIPFELEHRNGNRRDNRRENLILLCPNCHSQTPTWRRRKAG